MLNVNYLNETFKIIFRNKIFNWNELSDVEVTEINVYSI